MPQADDPGLAMAQSMMSEELKKQFAPKAEVEMPLYERHKRVHALKIAHVEHLRTDTTTDENPIVRIHFVELGFAPIEMNLRGKPTPDVGWYYVVYEDGYKSFSPAKAFDEGYTFVGPKQRPTIAQLKEILNKAEEDTPITIHADGSISA